MHDMAGKRGRGEGSTKGCSIGNESQGQNHVHSRTSHSKASVLMQHSTAQHSTAQHSTAQHSTAQHSTAQHSIAQEGTTIHSLAQ